MIKAMVIVLLTVSLLPAASLAQFLDPELDRNFELDRQLLFSSPQDEQLFTTILGAVFTDQYGLSRDSQLGCLQAPGLLTAAATLSIHPGATTMPGPVAAPEIARRDAVQAARNHMPAGWSARA